MICHGIEKDLVHAGLLKMDWPVYRRYGLSDDGTRRFSEIFDADETSLSSGSGDHTGGLVIPEDSDARHAFLMDLLGKKAAETLGVPSEELDVSKPLDSYGFDSLMAAELVVDIERMTRVALPKMSLLKGGLTIDGLVEMVEKELGRMLPIH
jgi:acyl carrier protein